MAAKRVSGTWAARAALERTGRGRNPVMPRTTRSSGSRQRSLRAPGPPEGERSARRNRARSAVHRPGHDGKQPAPPLTVRGVGLLAGGLLLGVGAGVTLERTLIGRDRRREDPEAGEPFGGIRGTPAKLTSHDGFDISSGDPLTLRYTSTGSVEMLSTIRRTHP